MGRFSLEFWKQAFTSSEQERQLKGLKREFKNYSDRLKGKPQTLAGIKDQCPLLSQKMKMILDEYGQSFPSKKYPQTEVYQSLKVDLRCGLYFFITTETVPTAELHPPVVYENHQINNIEISANTQNMDPHERERRGWREFYTLRFPYIPVTSKVALEDRSAYYVNAPEKEGEPNFFGYDLEHNSEQELSENFSKAMSEFLSMLVLFLEEQGV